MKTVCEINKCNGCMACADACPKKCIKIRDEITAFNAAIDEDLCINCKICEKTCPNVNKPEKIKPIEWKQGWAPAEIRKYSTSGGAASAIIQSFIQDGGFVASCLFQDGRFYFDITNDLFVAKKFAGSKYVKSNPTGIYKKIQERLKTDKVLFIGLPCQVAALKNYVKKQDNLYTIDLICHGTPSVKLLEKYLNESGYRLDKLMDIRFRTKTNMGLNSNNHEVSFLLAMDHYLCAFLSSVDYTENCYSCQFASIERVSDLTLGDSWGTEYKEQEKNGISLLLTQTKKGKQLICMAEMELQNVDLENAIANNHQLSHPSILTDKRVKFMKKIEEGKSFKSATFAVLPKMVLRQTIKGILIKLHLIKVGGSIDE
ncbi:Coenzyme F420 hydrogenase/dehydrogenase, beta subunit C-terminal domain [Agathobacter sp. LCP21S3_B2]|uniref:Coenzyme F420 hydrogenase/dehydrogenase, beta subunit C-terminal domain n=1 Tax=Agathobacter sp. LCP21S3_B2 TaxID=3438734 RepID=UPI003F925101